MANLLAEPGNRLLLQPYPLLAAIRKFYAGCLERSRDLSDGVTAFGPLRLRARHRIAVDARFLGQIADGPIQESARRSQLGTRYHSKPSIYAIVTIEVTPAQSKRCHWYEAARITLPDVLGAMGDGAAAARPLVPAGPPGCA
jgi:hypothetical protein